MAYIPASVQTLLMSAPAEQSNIKNSNKMNGETSKVVDRLIQTAGVV
jgi:hypothetical protein